MKRVSFCFILIALVCSCKKDQIIQHIIDPGKFISSKIKLSDFGSQASYIPLSKKPLIEWITSIQAADNKLFIAISPQQLLVYDFNGNFLHNVGNQGKGPGEYNRLDAFTIDELDKKIYVLDHNRILVFLWNGNFEQAIDISAFGGIFVDIGYLNNQLILFENINLGRAKYNWLVVDELGNEQQSKLNTVPEFKTQSTKLNKLTYHFKDHYGYWNSLNDTIFSISSNNYSMHYLFAQNNYRLTQDNFDDRTIYSQKIFRPDLFIESNKYLFIRYNMEGKSGHAVLNNLTGETQTLERKYTDDAHLGFINDLDGGVSFNPETLIKLDGNDYLVASVNSITLKEYIRTNEFKTSTPKYPEKHRELEELANSLSENDNPVLMLVKLKE